MEHNVLLTCCLHRDDVFLLSTIFQCLNTALRAEGFESSLKLPDKVLTFVRDHPLMENSVTSAPLLVRKGIRYTKLAVNQMGHEAEPSRVVLHLGTGEDRWR